MKADSTIRALGTPLAWPEAKTKVDQVRAWGIEVGGYPSVHFVYLSQLATIDDMESSQG